MHIFRTSFPKNTSGKLLLSNNIIGILMSWNWGDLLLKVSIFEHDLTFILTDGMLWRPFRSVYWRSLSLCSEWLWNYFLGYCLIKQWYVVITWSRLVGMRFCPVSPGSRQCYKLYTNYIPQSHVKSFILARRYSSFVLPGRNNCFSPSTWVKK